MDQVKLGIVGCGNISDAYLRGAARSELVAVKAVTDLVPELAAKRARGYGVAALSFEDLLADPEIAIVINLTVPLAHAETSHRAIEAGKHVYSEKPLTLSIGDAKALQRIARKNKLAVASAPDTFLGGAHQQARKAIDDGLIGKPASGTAHIMGPGMEQWHPNPDFFFKPGGGPILDMGPYYVANLINLLGPVKRVAALSGMARKSRLITSQPRSGQSVKVTTPTTYHALLEFVSGAQFTLSASWDVFAHRHPHMEIYGTEGAMFLPDPNFFGGEVLVAGKDGAPKALPGWDHPFGIGNHQNHDGMVANYRGAGLADLAAAIAGKRDARCGIDRMLHVVEVLTAIMASGASGKFVTLKSTCKRAAYLSPEAARALLK